ncbi:MAG: universal stress protein [Planctomycetes bacterium]|nr:universal stress protein [Planctomycetota bacterium]
MSIRIEKILYPTDFSKMGIVGLIYARELAELMNAQLHCLHVVDDAYQYWTSLGPESLPLGPPPDELLQMARDRIARFASEHFSNLKKSAITAVAYGRPFAEIIAYANENKIDLIVMGTHGRGAIAHVLLGSTTEKVLRKACCPVLTVRTADTQSGSK